MNTRIKELCMKSTRYLTMGLGVLVCLGLAPGVTAQDKKKSKYDAYEEFVRANKYVSYGSYKRAIPHYQRALEAEPQTYNIAHYNLGEIYRAQKNCIKSVFHYRAYLGTGTDPEALELSEKSIKECDTSTWPTLTVSTNTPDASVRINGFTFAQTGGLDAIKLGPGDYEIEVEAPEYIPQSRDVSLESNKPSVQDFKLEKQTFYGTTMVMVDQPGASMKLIPKKLDKPELSQGETVLTAPMKEAEKLPTGKYLLEITLEGYDRWIRHIYIARDQNVDVNVTLTKSIPVELRLPPESE